MENNNDNPALSSILDSVIRKFKGREQEGLVKYNTTMDRGDLSLIDWLVHLQEEMMDAVLYVEKLKQEIHYTEEVDPDMIINRPHLEFRDDTWDQSCTCPDCNCRSFYPGDIKDCKFDKTQ